MIKEQTPKLLLNFDINGTLILQDTSKRTTVDQMMMSAICDSTYGIWSEHCKKPITFRKYIDEFLCPGDKSKPEIKKKKKRKSMAFSIGF
jgi:hypothetical protein